MSASVSAMRGGQPSTTQPIAAPWLSPKVVTRKRWPKVLNDMEFLPLRCGSPRASRGQMALPGKGLVSSSEDAPPPWTDRYQVRPSCITGESVSREDVDHALVDGIMRGVLRRCEPEMRDQRARGAAVRGDDRVLVDRLVPVADSNGHLRIAFAARRREAPLVGFTLGDDMLVPRHDFRIGQPLPLPERDFGKLRFDRVTGGLEPERCTHDLHRLARTHERARHVIETFRRPVVAAKQVLQDLGAVDCLRAAFRVERHVVPALQPLLHVPIGEAVAHVVDDGPWHEFSRLPGSGVTWSALHAVRG